MMYDGWVFAKDVAKSCGFNMEKIYKSQKYEKKYFGKMLIVSKDFPTGDPFIDAALSLLPDLSSMQPFSEFARAQCLNKRQEDELKGSKYVQSVNGTLSFITPEEILSSIKMPTLVIENSEIAAKANGYLISIQMTNSTWICAY